MSLSLDPDQSMHGAFNPRDDALAEMLEDEEGDWRGNESLFDASSVRSMSTMSSFIMLPKMSFMSAGAKEDKKLGVKRSMSTSYDDSSLSSGTVQQNLRRTFYKIVLSALNTVGVGIGAYKSKTSNVPSFPPTRPHHPSS